jgi:hypothetical protein
MGSICVRCQKETTQSLLPTAISLMSASKARWTIVKNVDEIKIRDSHGCLKYINNSPGYFNNDYCGKPHVDGEWAMSR